MLDRQVHKDHMVSVVIKEILVEKGHMDHKAFGVRLVRKEKMVRKVQLVQRETEVT
jgi:hypothetical protein